MNFDKDVIKNQRNLHKVTFVVHQNVDVFTEKVYVEILIENLKFCQDEKGLRIYAWIIVSNTVHLIIDSSDKNLSDIIRDFKKYTSKKIFKTIEENEFEKRKRWMLWLLKKDENIWFWEEGYNGKEIFTETDFKIHQDLIHNYPVKLGLVTDNKHYNWSSASNTSLKLTSYSGL